MSIEAIVACAGRGKRLRKNTIKPLVDLAGAPIFVHTIRALSRSPLINKIILVVKRERMARFAELVRKYRLKKIKAVIPGGKTRSQSVKNGLKLLDKKTRLVVIHDGVRPFVDQQLIDKTIKEAARCGAAIVAVPVSPTIHKVNPARLEVEAVLDRRQLWEVQTPQVFKKEIILKAYKKFKGPASDDATLVNRMGRKVKVVRGTFRNIKITTPEDLELARIFLKWGA
jgi:2-C-methyl-D-erythritol 4-phosphate cytidylyltransferase